MWNERERLFHLHHRRMALHDNSLRIGTAETNKVFITVSRDIMRKDKSATQSNKEMTEMAIVETSKVFFFLKKQP